MSDVVVDTPVAGTGPVLRRLSVLDRWLPAWILAAMTLGLLLGRLVPGLAGALDAVKVGSVSLPIAVGLLEPVDLADPGIYDLALLNEVLAERGEDEVTGL